MDLLERFVANSVYIKPMMDRTFRIHGMAGAIDPDTGKPRNWDEYVQKERVRRGVGMASSPSPVASEPTWPAVGSTPPVNESIEEQIERIDALLNEKEAPIDLRIYAIQVGCSVDGSVAGDQMEVETQIRGVDGVTIVKSVPERKRPLTPTAEYTVFELKFEILGAMNRVQYRSEVLLPALRQIPGINVIDWSPIHRTNVRGTIRTVREGYYGGGAGGFGGVAGLLGSAGRPDSVALPTPRPALQKMIDDWSEGGVQLYDTPMNTTDMRYSVMMPVDELTTLMNRTYRGDMNDFYGRYQNFIRDGAMNPVYLAIGQNGRAKITGGEDLVWFAKESGLEELPVFISYQKQA
jgi:hypothetical protein